MTNIAGILLAAGESKRYGGNKLLARHHTGGSLISYATRQLRQLVEQQKLSCFYIVTGRWHSQIESELDTVKPCLLYNHNWQHGIASSLRVGVSEVLKHDNSITHVMISLADLALVTSTSLTTLIDTAKEFPETVVFSQWEEQMSVPAIFPRHCFHLLMELTGDKGAKRIIKHCYEQGQAIGVNHPESQFDIDTQSDWDKVP